jgi:small GTP-binding protein
MSSRKPKLKVVMLGEGRVGKTSLLQRFLTNTFDEGSVSTVEARMYSNVKMEVRGVVADVALWDTAGQERFRALGPIYYRDADGAVLTYDITDKESFMRVRVWLKELRQVVGDNVAIVVAANKCDLDRERKVSKHEAEAWCADNGAEHILCSAKLNLKVGDIFQTLVSRIVERRQAQMGASASASAAAAAAEGAFSAAATDGVAGRGMKQRGVRLALDDEPATTPARGGSSGGGSSGPCCK